MLIGLSILAFGSGLAAFWLIVRARRAAPIKSVPLIEGWGKPREGLRQRLDEFWARLAEALHQLGTRGEWRYRVPWILLAGEAGSGKSSLADSIEAGRNDHPGERAEQLRIPGTRWSFFDRGILIDLGGESLPQARDDYRRWNEFLRQLIGRRPERALDGVVLVLSARTLASGNRADVMHLAESSYSQLSQLLERCEFLLPVYVVVTQCDFIEGFATFWAAQPEKCRTEIFGWSNPSSLESEYVPQWMDDAFAYLGSILKQLQLQAAAADVNIASADEFFLFPQRFLALRETVSAVLAQVFRVSAYRAAPFFRGVYFTGAIESPADDPLRPRAEVAFVDQLFTEKIFAEQNLARPIRQALWSRHLLTRRLQYGALALAAMLCLSLVRAAISLQHQVDVGMASAELIRNPQHAARRSVGCVTSETVFELLRNMSLMDVNMTELAIPASWVDRRIQNNGLHLVADEALEKVIFPAFACELVARAKHIADPAAIVHTVGDSLVDDRERLQKYLGAVSSLEQNLARFRRITSYVPAAQSNSLLSDLDALVQYLYSEPLPAAVRNSSGYHIKAIAAAVYRQPLSLPQDMRAQVSQRVAQFSVRARQEIWDEIDAGASLLDALAKERSPVLENAQLFDRWVQQMRVDWTTATSRSNPCSLMEDLLRPKLDDLVGHYGYDSSLRATPDLFEAAQCYEPAVRRLSELHVAPHGVVFHHDANRWELTPALQAEADGLSGEIGLDVMQLAPTQPFGCQRPVVGWSVANLDESAGFVREYRGYLAARHVDESQAALPLFARVLRRQLQSVLDDEMTRAQITATAVQPAGTFGTLAASEQALAQESSDLARTYTPLAWILDQYRQLGFDAGTPLTQCVRRYASDALRELALLSEASGLYDVQTNGAEDGSAGYLFALGSVPQAKDYLQGQFERARVLASYSGPFVSVLQNTEGNADPTLPPEANPVYWDNTSQEVNRTLQFKDPNAQPTLLNDYVTKQLTQLTSDNCHDVLGSYTPASYGNDLFSQRRRGLENEASWSCRDQNRALALSQYQGWARRFGTELAGRFPFAAVDASPEADLLVTRNFFLDYTEQRDALRKQLGKLSEASLKDVGQFLDQLDIAAKLFATAGGDPQSLPPLKLKVSFRALPTQSSGAQNILSWRLGTDEAAATSPNGVTDIDWRYGQGVTLIVTWAALSPVVPVADPQQPDMQVDGNVVTFRADGAWSLMKLILRHAAQSPVRTDTLDQGTALLELRVPTQGRQSKDPPVQSRVYVAIRLLGVDPKTQAPTPLRWPGTFPTYAPTVW